MDLNKFSIRELKAACVTWNIRTHKLLRLWGQTPISPTRFKINAMLQVLDNRYKAAADLYFKKIEAYNKEQEEYKNQYVLLECRDFMCPITVGIKRKDYSPGEHKCPVCCRYLYNPEEKRVDHLLRELGIGK